MLSILVSTPDEVSAYVEYIRSTLDEVCAYAEHMHRIYYVLRNKALVILSILLNRAFGLYRLLSILCLRLVANNLNSKPSFNLFCWVLSII